MQTVLAIQLDIPQQRAGARRRTFRLYLALMIKASACQRCANRLAQPIPDMFLLHLIELPLYVCIHARQGCRALGSACKDGTSHLLVLEIKSNPALAKIDGFSTAARFPLGFGPRNPPALPQARSLIMPSSCSPCSPLSPPYRC